MQPAWRSYLLICLCLFGCTEGPSPSSVEELLAGGAFEEATQQAGELVRNDARDPSLRVLIGRVYLAARDGAAAQAAFERARELGSTEPSLDRLLIESLILQEKHQEVRKALPPSLDRSAMEPSLIDLRLHSLLRTPLAGSREIFLDARHRLEHAGPDGAEALEKVTLGDGVISANADHVRRAIAFWSCQQATAPPRATVPPTFATYQPPWADLSLEGRRVLKVGPGRELKTPRAAALIARDGDVVEIDAGMYEGDVAVWRANNLWLRAIGGKAVLASGGATAEDSGIWVIRANNTVVDDIRFVGARATHKNGSGIRMLGGNVWIRGSEFHDNEAGLLTNKEPGEVIVERSVFTESGAGDGLSHNVYIGPTDRLIFRFNYSMGAKVGHQLKSRAYENYILYNRLADELEGDSSYTIDLPEGGYAVVLGNEIQQGPKTVNRHMVSLGAEQPTGRRHQFIFAFNTFYNHTYPATLIRDATGTGIALIDNLFAGAPAALDALKTHSVGNAFDATSSLVDPAQNDYRLKPSAPVLDSAEPAPMLDAATVTPEFEYVHPASFAPRHDVWYPDPGAHEFCGWPE